MQCINEPRMSTDRACANAARVSIMQLVIVRVPVSEHAHYPRERVAVSRVCIPIYIQPQVSTNIPANEAEREDVRIEEDSQSIELICRTQLQ